MRSRGRDYEVAANRAHEIFLHLAMPWQSRDLARRCVHVNRMIATFAKEAAAHRLEMANQVDALHVSR